MCLWAFAKSAGLDISMPLFCAASQRWGGETSRLHEPGPFRLLNTHLRNSTTMNSVKKKTLEVAGWKFGDACDFLGMIDEERQLLDARMRELRAPTGQPKSAQGKQSGNAAECRPGKVDQ
jgi:hypothetical protein